MKKVLWIACLLLVMPFFGYSQNHAGLAQQDDEALYGPGPVSTELPSQIQLNNIERHRANETWAHAMFVPTGNHHYGVYYEVFEDGTINWVQRYNEYYFSAAEYYKPYPATGDDLTFPVWAYADDLTRGYNRLMYVEGDPNSTIRPVQMSMNELTYDYVHNAPGREGRMLGMKFGNIYQVNMEWGTPNAGSVELLYDYTEHEGIGRPITLACDLDGTLYFVSLSEDGQSSSKLYKFEADDEDLENPIEVGEVGWPAQHLQTMAFNHKTRELIWWQCDKDNNTNLVRINTEDASTELLAETGTTEMAGLIFEFEYKPYNVLCIEAEEGEVLVEASAKSWVTSTTYKPGKEVEFKITAEPCYSVETVYVYEHGTTTNPIFTIPAEDLVNGVGSFIMPACDVDIVGEWVGNEHEVELTWTPASITDALVFDNGNGVYECGDEVVVEYARPVGYYVTNITAKQGTTNLTVTVDKEDSTISFEMPDGDVVVEATYQSYDIGTIDDLCQYESMAKVPVISHTPDGHQHIYTFTDPEGEEHVYGPASCSEIDATLLALTFDIPGTWSWNTVYITTKYGGFPSETKTFEVFPAPKSIAIQEEYEIEADVIYNAHYNCDGDSILLKVVADPADYVFNGTFTWTKDGEEVYTSTDPVYLIKPCNVADAGNYNVTYVPNVSADSTVEVDSPCEFTLDEDFAVNVATIPNTPIIDIQGGENPICYHSSVILEWKYGVLNPDEYDIKWYTVDEQGIWTIIEGETDIVLATAVLDEAATYGLQINYAHDGHYALCHRESEPFTVEVKEEAFLEILGDTATCKGINPEVNPSVEGDYTDFTWAYNGNVLAETSNTLHFENTANGNLVDHTGEYWIEVSAKDPEGCTIYGEMKFTVKELPDVMIWNNIQPDDTAHVDDNPTLQIEICAGKLVTLRGLGADNYIWGEGLDAVEANFIQVKPMENTTYSVQGYNEETGCWNTASIEVVVRPRPEVAWVLPTVDTMFSMITDEYQLVATPAGGIFTYIIPSEPDVDYPIDNGVLKPSELGIGEYQLIYSYTDENGCTSERRIRNITITKPYWTDKENWDPMWYDNCLADGGRFEVTTPEQLGSFMAYVYGLNGVTQNDFAEDTIWIENDIDLQEKPYFYRPFCDTAVFKGVIDGTGHVVTNMTILEDNLNMYVDGFVRNVGVKDAKVTSVGDLCVVDVNEDARFHNSYITMPELVNVVPNLNPFQDMMPTGEVRNVYYYGIVPGAPVNIPLAIYLDNGVTPVKLLHTPMINANTLLHEASSKPEEIQYEGILEEWVWLQNDFYYRTWITDAAAPGDYENYGYPMLDKAFIHHHYITVEGCDEAEFELEGISQRTIDGKTYDYVMNGDVVTINYTPDTHVYIDQVNVSINGYNGETTPIDTTFTNTTNATSFEIDMPVDSLYLPAYDVAITTTCARDYWTDEGNYNADWYDNCMNNIGRLEINSNEDLAALAWECWPEGGNRTFEGDTIWINGSETVGSELIDMTEHMWRPIYNFAGVIDGTHFIVDNLYIRPIEGETEATAMFINCSGVIRNMGIQDADLPADGDVATYVFNDGQHNASVINSFATNDPSLHLQYPIASEGTTVTNCYTLDNNGNMITHEGDGIDLAALHAWVVNENSEYYWDWKNDEEPINYYYPIHSVLYDGGFAITYVPSIYDHDADTTGTIHGYVDGPAVGHEGEEITILITPDYCYNCTRLTIDGEDHLFTNHEQTITFTMPDHPITIEATFAPIEWTLTINYVVADEPAAAPAPYVGQYHYGDEIEIASPELEDYEPVEGFEVVELTMPCGHKEVTVEYIGKKHAITFCEGITTFCEDYGTDMTNDSARYHQTVNVSFTAPAGFSIPNSAVTIYNTTDGAEVSFTGNNGSYTFEMPAGDVEICAEFTEEFWDDYGIADISWFIDNEDQDHYVLSTDSMLGGLAALVSGREWLVDEGYYTQEEVNGFTFEGVSFIVESEQEEGMIDLIEHKWRPIGAQLLYTRYFQGYFDGNNTEIVNMRTADFTVYDEPGNGSCQAFFGNIGENGVVTNLRIEGTATGRYFTAGIAGVNYGTIINSVAAVTVFSEFEAGGIVGNNFGDVINSYCMADTITCMSAQPLRSTNNYYVGGVAAYNGGRISNCHSVAFLKRGGGTDTSDPHITGNNPINFYGGVIGMNDTQLADHCYWTINPIEEGVGKGEALVNSAVMTATTATTMNATAQALAAELGIELNGWKQGPNGYPIFDVARMMMDNDENSINVNLYPNPTHSVVNIFSDNIQKVTVFNMFGQMVLDTEVNGNQTTIDMSSFSAGIYMVRIATAEGVATRNVVVE